MCGESEEETWDESMHLSQMFSELFKAILNFKKKYKSQYYFW